MPNLKNMATDPRVRSIFQKHLGALTRDLVALSYAQTQELTEELASSMLAGWGLTREDLQLHAIDVAAPDLRVVSAAPSIVPSALIYDAAVRVWTCPRCRVFSDPRRRSVTAHLRFCKAELPTTLPPPRTGRKKSRSAKKST